MYFDRKGLRVRSIKERVHDLDIGIVKQLGPVDFQRRSLQRVAERMIAAKEGGRGIIIFMGGHVVRSGVQRYLIDLLEKGYVTCIAMNGSVMIHDFEFALVGATTESVSRYIRDGQFGLWEETGLINDIVNAGHRAGGIGMGEAVGKYIFEGDFPNKGISILAACSRLNIPATVHIGIGYDIIHELPNFDGAAAGALSYLDFLRLAGALENIEKGVVMNFGSAVMAPEVFLKALSMARNKAHTEDREIRHFTTLVCDLYPLPEDFSKEPPKDDPSYYFRPWKTMLLRTVADGGESYYVQASHANTIPGLWTAIHKLET